MATLQSIRKQGPLLVVVIGVALLAFVVGDFFKVFQTHSGASDVGEVNGNSYSVMDFQQQVNEMADMYKSRTGRSLSDNEMSYMRDQVWNAFVMQELLGEESKNIGISVSDEEVQAVIEEGRNPMLNQSPIGVNPQTGMFDKEILKQFLVAHSTQLSQMDAQTAQMYQELYKQWSDFENQLRLSLLAEKYQSLFANGVISNNVEAEYTYNGRVNQYDALYAAIPYRTIPDSTVSVADSDLRKLYDKYKEFRFKQDAEGRDFKYIRVDVVASEADKNAILANMEQCATDLKAGIENYGAFVRSESSTVEFVDMMRLKSALPSDVSSRIDSTSAGQVVGPYMNLSDNTYNVFKLISKANEADSVQFRNIVAYKQNAAEAQQLADSILNAAKGGADFGELAKKYQSNAEGQWVSTSQFNSGIDDQNAKYFAEIFASDKGAIYKSTVGGMTVITQVMDKRGSVEKYKVAVVKRPITFSDETYRMAYNNFSQFIASNQTLADFEKNAEEAGYRVLESKDMLSNAYSIANIPNSREALRWAFTDAKEGQVSQVFECGDNNAMLALVVTGKHEAGYLDFEFVKDELRPEAVKDKKAEKIMADLSSKNLKDITAYKALPDVVSDTLKHVSFSSPVNVMRVGGGEYVLNGLVVKSQTNQLTKPVKGNAAVYVLDVISTNKTNEQFDSENEKRVISSTYGRSAAGVMNDLYNKAKVVDKRYLFF